MATEAALLANPLNGPAKFGELIRTADKELAEIRRANRAADAEIRRLRATTRRRLERIRANLSHVESLG